MIHVELEKPEGMKHFVVRYNDERGQEQSIPAFSAQRDSLLLRKVIQGLLNGDVEQPHLRYVLSLLPTATLERMITLGLVSPEQARPNERLVDDLKRFATARRKAGHAANEIKTDTRLLTDLFHALDWYHGGDMNDGELRAWFQALPTCGPRWDHDARPRETGAQRVRALIPFGTWRAEAYPDAGNPLEQASTLLLDDVTYLQLQQAGLL